MTKRTTFLLLLCLPFGALVLANIFAPRTTAEKVAEAELIVQGVATLEGLPLEATEHPVERLCTITVLQTLWPSNLLATNTVVVNMWVWTKWSETWWNYNSQTGLYFFESTTTALKKARREMKRRSAFEQMTIDDKFFGTNSWMPLGGGRDWYEPATNITAIQQLIEKSK